MPIPYVDECTAVAIEVTDLMRQGWSQRLWQLQQWQWANGCPQAEPPQHGSGWANDFDGYPPTSYTYPGSPSDRRPPQW